MTTPRSSMRGTLPAEPMKGSLAMHPTQKSLGRKTSMKDPMESFFLRESKALGAVQVMNGLFHFALGGLLLFHIKLYAPICMTLWYPFWGGTLYIISGSLLAAAETSSRASLVKGKIAMNSLSLFAAISGMILLIMDIFNVTVSHFFKMDSLNLIKTSAPPINIHKCEPSDPSEKNALSIQYCQSVRSIFLGIFAMMLTFVFLQKLVTAGIVENGWKRLCPRPKANVVLLSAGGRKEEPVVKTEVIEMTQIPSQPPNEEGIEIIPVLEEEEEETEANFPEPPQDQEPSPMETDLLN